MYTAVTLAGVAIDSQALLGATLVVLVIAGLEFSVGLLLYFYC